MRNKRNANTYNEGIIEGGKDASDAKDMFTISNSWAQSHVFFLWLSDLSPRLRNNNNNKTLSVLPSCAPKHTAESEKLARVRVKMEKSMRLILRRSTHHGCNAVKGFGDWMNLLRRSKLMLQTEEWRHRLFRFYI